MTCTRPHTQRNAAAPVDLFSADGAGHGMIDDPDWREQTHPVVLAFLANHVGT